METPPSYPVHTSGKFWGGTVLPYWVLMVVTALPFTGFFGIDHLVFRSPSTAILKFITNVFTLGFWYFYDIVQVFTDKPFIKEYGLSKPGSGPAGLGLDYFRGITKEKDALGPSTVGGLSVVFFILYLFTSLVPFGVSNFVAGDVEGGVAKFLLSFGLWGIFWIPFLFVAGFFEVFRNIMEPEKIFTEGAVRPPPVSLLLNSTGYSPNIMNPATIESEKGKSTMSLYAIFVQPVLKFFGFPDPKEILDTTKCQVVPPIEKTVTAAKTAANGVAKLAGTVPQIATEATEKLSAFTDPEKLKEAATKLQSGGGALTPIHDILLMSGLVFLILGGLSAAFLRKALRRKDGDETRDDTPSQPQLL